MYHNKNKYYCAFDLSFVKCRPLQIQSRSGYLSISQRTLSTELEDNGVNSEFIFPAEEFKTKTVAMRHDVGDQSCIVSPLVVTCCRITLFRDESGEYMRVYFLQQSLLV